MTRIKDCFLALHKNNRAALVTFVTAGDPDYDTALALLKRLPEAGADIIELGMPFTDPMADGPTIQKASLRALKAGQTLSKTLQMVAEFRKENQTTPIVLMGYFNPIHHYGVEQFLDDALQAGVDGLIVVDLPLEHDNDFCTPAQRKGIDFIRLITPTTDEKRLSAMLANGSGFVYYVSVAGVTGAGSATQEHLEQAMQKIKNHTTLPVCVGFGIRSADQAATVAQIADGVVVGSALVSHIEAAQKQTDKLSGALGFCQILSAGVKKVEKVR